MGVIEALLQQGREMYREEVRKELFEEGRAEGRAEVFAEGVMNLLRTQRYTIAEIANFLNVTEAFVRKVKKEIK